MSRPLSPRHPAFNRTSMLVADIECLAAGMSVIQRRPYSSGPAKDKIVEAYKLLSEASELLWKELENV